MASNILSRFLPGGPSIYENLRSHDQGSDIDLEERAGMAIDEENLGADFHEHEFDHPDLFNDEESRINSESTAFLPSDQHTRNTPSHTDKGKGIHYTRSPRIIGDDGGDEVPMSLLIEEETHHKKTPTRNKPRGKNRSYAMPIPTHRPSNRDTQARWESAQAQQQLYPDDGNQTPINRIPTLAQGAHPLTRAERSLWMWINLEDLDSFIRNVYDYYVGAGIWCILLERMLNLLIIVFLAVFLTFLTKCLDFTKLRHHDNLADIMVPKCTQKLSGIWNVGIFLLFAFTLSRIYASLTDIAPLMRMHDFYLHCLNIPDSDMQTISWPVVVSRLMALRDANPRTSTQKLSPATRKWLNTQSKERMSPQDIANRLMRRENYLIALFNKEILDFSLPIPFFGGSQLYSKTMEWSINYCIFDMLISATDNQVLPLVLKDSSRRKLSEALKNRFRFLGIMNLLCAPVFFVGMFVMHFFQYFNEYQKNPSALSARRYTPLAQWKFREFNEVQHLFEERLNMSYPFATRYIEQFPKLKMVQFWRCINFISGAIIAVLALFTILDPESSLGFQITKDRTVLFYLGIFGAIWKVSKSSIPEENQVFDPEYSMRAVIDYTHYSPAHWADRLHTDEVKREFSTLYQMKTVIWLNELLGVIFTPFILLFTLPKCSDRIIDFFREFSLHVDGLGYVCSFAEFDFKNGAAKADKKFSDSNPDGDLRDEYYSTQHGKMAASYYNFIDNYHINPQTGIPGHVPRSSKRQTQFHPPPSFPGLMSASLNADVHGSKLNRRVSRGIGTGERTPRFPPAANASPMTSMMLDQHNPSGSGREAKRTSRSQYRSTRNIRQETIEDEDEDEVRTSIMRGTTAFDGSGGLDESKWETSPTRNPSATAAETTAAEPTEPVNPGVLGMLYQFGKAHTEGARGPAGVNF